MSIGLDGVRLKSSQVELQFPTCAMSRQYEGVDELNRRLSALMMRLEKEARDVSATTSTVGGFQTDNNLLSRPEPEIKMLGGMIGQAVEEYLEKLFQVECSKAPTGLNIQVWGWGINMREGDINSPHVHPNAKVSGTYYVSMPPAKSKDKNTLKPEGAIIFTDPRPRANMNRIPHQVTDITVPPRPGQMILFPSYLEHFVLPFRGNGVRTCIAFNAQF